MEANHCLIIPQKAKLHAEAVTLFYIFCHLFSCLFYFKYSENDILDLLELSNLVMKVETQL